MHYHFKVYKKDGFYWARCIELRECSTQAATYIELKRNMKRVLEAYLEATYDQAGAKIILPRNPISKAKEVILTVPVPKALAKNIKSRARKRPNPFGVTTVLPPAVHLDTTGEELKNYIIRKIRHFGQKRFSVYVSNQVATAYPEARNWISEASYSLLPDNNVVSLNIELRVPSDFFGDPMELVYSRHVEKILSRIFGMPFTVTLVRSDHISSIALRAARAKI